MNKNGGGRGDGSQGCEQGGYQGGCGGGGRFSGRDGGRVGYQGRGFSYHNNKGYQNYNQNNTPNVLQQNFTYHGQNDGPPGGNYGQSHQGDNHYPPQQQQESYTTMQRQTDPGQGNSNPWNGFRHYNVCESNFDNAQQGNGRPSWW